MKELIVKLLSYDYFVVVAMSVVICLITQLIKAPIKFFTNKIKNSNIEDRITTLFMLIPLALGVVGNFLYNTYYLHIAFSVLEGLSWGTASIAFYQAFKKALTGKTPSKKEIEAVNQIKVLTEKITKDGKVDGKDVSAVKEFLDKVGK